MTLSSLPKIIRQFNQQGEAFESGETLSGLDYEIGQQVVERLRPFVPDGTNMKQLALRGY